MVWLFHSFFFQPLFNVLVAIYNFLPNHDLGLSIIILTILVKAALFPISWKQIKAQKEMQDIQPHLEEIKARYKDDKQALMQAQVELFKQHKINPLSSCLPVLVQLPFLIAIYWVFINGLRDQSLNDLYSFVQNPGHLNSSFLGIMTLTTTHTLVLPIIAGAMQFVQTWMLNTKRPPKVAGSKDEDFAVIMNRQMMVVMPLMTVWIGYQFPAGLALYWLTNTVITVGQQLAFLRHGKNKAAAIEVLPPAPAQ